jgi:hypothetical protein
MGMNPSSWLQAVLGVFKPKIEVSKGDAGWALGGAVLGGVVDLAFLPAGVTVGTSSAMGAGAGYACKAGLDSAWRERRERQARKEARARAERAQAYVKQAPDRAKGAIAIFENARYEEGERTLGIALELHEKNLKSDLKLSKAVDAAVKDYEDWAGTNRVWAGTTRVVEELEVEETRYRSERR